MSQGPSLEEVAGSDPEREAAFWDARLRSPDCTEKDRSAFAEWKAADPANGAAFDSWQHTLAGLRNAYIHSPELQSFREQALRVRGPRLGLVAASMAAVGLLALGGGYTFFSLRDDSAPIAAAAPSVYETATGQRSTVELSDGSKVTLDSKSRLEVSFGASGRHVKLTEGRARFNVAHDTRRPFTVAAGSRQVTAVGTVFDVRLDQQMVKVTLFEGRVRVSRPHTTDTTQSERALDLAPGQELTVFAGNGDVQLALVDTEAATLWTQGRIVLDDVKLVDALSEISRYSAKPIILQDSSLAELRVNGTFQLDDPLSFVSALSAYLPLEARTSAEEIVLVRRSAVR